MPHPSTLSHLSVIVHTPARRLLLGAASGLLLCAVLALTASAGIAVLAGITAAEVVYLLSSLLVVLPMDGDATRRNARREDLRPAADEILVGVACALAVMTMVAVRLGPGGAGSETLSSVLTVLGVFAAWACIQQTYAQHYAFEYFREESGIDFSSEDTPDYRDFLYFSTAIGMTYGVTDCTATERRIRRIVLRHALLSFLFGTILLAAAVSLLGGLITGG